MTNRDNRAARSFQANAFAAGLLAVLVSAAVTWPIEEYAQSPGWPAAAPSQRPAMNFAAWPASSSKISMEFPPRAPNFDFGTPTFDRSPSSPGAGVVNGGSAAGNPWFAPFSFPKIVVAPSGAGSASGGSNEKKHVAKGGLILGITGVTVAALGVVLAASNRQTSCANQLLTGACNDVHTAGVIMIPTGAALAVTGFYLAFRHK